MRCPILFCAFLFVASVNFESPAQQPNDSAPASRLIVLPIDDSLRTTLPGNVHPLARPELDRGEAPPDLPLNRMLLILKRSPRQEEALQQLLQDQQNIHSAAYHQWLTPEQFGERFGPASADIDAVTQWLQSNGFQVSQVSKSRQFIEFSGNATQVKQAFGTAIHRFMPNGEQHWANAGNPSIPIALAPVVAGVDSLHNFEKQAQHTPLPSDSSRSGGLLAVAPDYTILNGSNGPPEYALGPYDFAAIYDLLPLWSATPIAINGAGQTIAIAGRSDINPADAQTFWTSYGLDGVHAPEPKLVVTYNGPNPGKTGDESEADIDTQWSGAVAPGATINLVTSQSTTTTDGIDLSSLYIVDNNLASVMSVSYGQCETTLGSSGVQFYGSLWEQAAAQGISVFVSSGDNGAAGCDNPGLPAKNGLQVNGLASTPFNAAVGGTDFNQYEIWTNYWSSTNASITGQSAIGYIPETSWNDSCANGVLALVSGGTTNAETNCNNSTFKSFLNSTGGSGGSSSSWLKPVWQTGTPSDNARDLPDISLFASNGFLSSYYIFCQSDNLNGGCTPRNGAGGTSFAAPAFAGIMALVNQKTGSAQGIPGLTLYKLDAQQPTAFHDVPTGSTIAMPCVTGSPKCTTTTTGDAYGILSGYSTTAGYDLATGLGSVDIANLVNRWSSVSFTPSTTTLTLNGGAAVNITHGSPVPFTINVSPSAATGEAALMVAPGTPGDPGVAAFALSSGSAASSTMQLPGGSYSVLAHYSGDSTYGGSYSNSVPVTISPEASAVLANLVLTNVNGVPTSFSASSATYGSGYQIFRVDVGDAKATVSPSAGISSQCSAKKENCPTGKVTLKAPGTVLDGTTLALNGEGYAESAILPTGSYAVTGTYSGDASYGAGSANATFTISKAPTTISAGDGTSSIPYGSQTQLAVDALTTSDGKAPTGTFQFFVDGSPLPGPTAIYESSGWGGVVNGNPEYAWADATATTYFLSVGNHAFYVSYSGDANYAAGTSPVVTVSVGQDYSTFTTFGVANPAVAGQSATAAATLLGSQYGAAPTGTVTFYDGGTALPGTVTYTSSTNPGMLNATSSVVFSTPGTHQITVSYSGDTNYTSVTGPVAQSLVVLGPVSVKPAGSASVSLPGQTGSTTLAVMPNGGFTGTATLSCTPDPKANESTCSLANGTTSGSTLQVNVTSAGLNVTFNVTTTAAHQSARLEEPLIGKAFGITLAFIPFLFLPLFKRHRKYLLCLVALAFALGVGACGGGGSGGGSGGGGGGGTTDPGTAAGTYSFTVTASTGSGASVINSTTQVSVVVN